ncbi:hypothetical protein SNE40_003753 [Patella caerulea]|uniref:Uncharacterized protein n=1 Tax=Patella caerulea TaxID=87958 RepID=A0AAN8KAH0_PATCE
MEGVSKDGEEVRGVDSNENNSQQTHKGTTQSTRSTEETDNASKQSILPTQGNNSLYRNTTEGVSKHSEEVRGLDSNIMIMGSTGAVIFILAVASCIAYKKCCKNRKARAVQRMVPMSSLERPGD